MQDRANGDAVTVDAYVVSTQVEPGTYGEEATAAIKKEKIPRKIVPSNAVKDLTQIQGKVTTTRLVPNQVVTTDMFVSPADAQTSFADRLGTVDGTDMVSFTMNLDPTHAAAGLLTPGDFVNILSVDQAGGSGSGSAPDSGSAPNSGSTSAANYVYLKAQIVAIDQTPMLAAGEKSQTAGSSTDQSSSSTTAAPKAAAQGLITLRVPTKVAQVLASIPTQNLYLSLVGKDYKPEPQTPFDPNAQLPADNPQIVTPYGPTGMKTDK